MNGWVIEFIAKKSKKKYPTSTGDKPLKRGDLVCPKCGKDLFRTEASIKFVPAKDQTPPLIAEVDYEVIPIEY